LPERIARWISAMVVSFSSNFIWVCAGFRLAKPGIINAAKTSKVIAASDARELSAIIPPQRFIHEATRRNTRILFLIHELFVWLRGWKFIRGEAQPPDRLSWRASPECSRLASPPALVQPQPRLIGPIGHIQ
jgi:hypothetical protein